MTDQMCRHVELLKHFLGDGVEKRRENKSHNGESASNIGGIGIMRISGLNYIPLE